MIVQRKNILRDLLIGIYSTERINYNENQIFIGDNFLLDRCDFSKGNKYYNYRGQFEELFKLTFCRPYTFFGIDTNGSNCKPDKLKKGQTQFTKEHAIRNTYHFLKNQGVNFDILGDPNFQDIEFWGHLIFDILCVYLKYLFDTDFSDDCDGIQMLSKKLFTKIDCMLVRKSFGTGDYEHTTELNSVVEDCVSKDDCNRYISVTICDMGIPSVMPFHSVSATACIIKKKETERDDSEYPLDSTNWMMTELCFYDPNTDEVFPHNPISIADEGRENYIYISSNSFSISHIFPDADKVNKFVIYYLLNINESKVKVFYPEIRTPYALRKAIIAKGYEKLLTLFKMRISEYYADVIDYIEDINKRILSINIERLITGDIDKELAAAFNIDYDYMVDFFKSNNVLDERNLYLYLMIDRALTDFTHQLNIGTDETAKQIVQNIDKEKIEKHLEKLMKFISSAKIRSAVLFQEADENAQPEKYWCDTGNAFSEQQKAEMYKKRSTSLFRNLKNAVEKYAYLLQLYLQQR